MSQHNAIIKAYFGSTEDNALSFEGFIRCHFLHIRNSLGSDCSTEFGKWFGMYCEQAKLHDIKIIRGQAKKAWNELVIPKTPTSKKRSYFVANVGEEVEVLKKKLAFEDGDDEMMLKKFNDFRTACIDEFKQAKQTRSMHCDLDKLLAIQGILRLGKKTSPPVAAAFGEESVASFWKKMKKEKFGEVKSMTESTRKQLEDALEDFDDDDNDDEMERKLLQLQLNSSSDESRVIKVLLSMFQHMTEGKEAVDEIRLQSGIVSSFCQLFKLSRKHDIFGCNKILFSELSALKDCRPDFAVKVQANNTIINSIGEIKGTKSCPESVALDTYRLGIFGMNMLWKYQLKNSMVFQVHGQEVVLWMCAIHQGICLMIEVERILLPTTYLEFVDIKGKLNKLYNLSLLYKNHCVEEESKAKPWQLLSYEAVKALYGLVTTASKASTAKDSTIPEASSSTEVGL